MEKHLHGNLWHEFSRDFCGLRNGLRRLICQMLSGKARTQINLTDSKTCPPSTQHTTLFLNISFATQHFICYPTPHSCILRPSVKIVFPFSSFSEKSQGRPGSPGQIFNWRKESNHLVFDILVKLIHTSPQLSPQHQHVGQCLTHRGTQMLEMGGH